ncbi:TetR/AcrR family transcriptional regulator [Chitinispirillales bacterium ANBcel5]|uniref:TetR/AcrR family transcriptional regulator n=1 Tax=Cellulosispirillum alkaliphilum TaxID=3039283 RepID=UPI002A51F4BA|nr:TetR/AcrR family transcriptional regulator [Chitinispirillales bacterium ANBcel5]
MAEYSNRQLQIIDTAIELIAEGGIQELTMKHLADRIGISEPAIYRHFKSKMEILEALQRLFAGEKSIFMKQMLKRDISAIEKIELIMKYHFTSFAAKPALAAVMFSEGIFQNDRRLASAVLAIMQQSGDALATIVREGQKASEIRNDIEPQHLVTIILGSLRLMVNRWHLHRYTFDLLEEGKVFIKSLKTLLNKGQ